MILIQIYHSTLAEGMVVETTIRSALKGMDLFKELKTSIVAAMLEGSCNNQLIPEPYIIILGTNEMLVYDIIQALKKTNLKIDILQMFTTSFRFIPASKMVAEKID